MHLLDIINFILTFESDARNLLGKNSLLPLLQVLHFVFNLRLKCQPMLRNFLTVWKLKIERQIREEDVILDLSLSKLHWQIYLMHRCSCTTNLL